MSTERFERRLAAIIAADMVGFSRLMEIDEEGTLARQLDCRNEIIDPLVAKHKGRIFKTTGDGLLVEFPSVVEAVQAALAIQSKITESEADQSDERRICYRIGINLGDILLESEDAFGDGVNIAARLEQIAAPGGVCLSEDAFRQLRGDVASMFIDGGVKSLKNISRPVRVFQYSGVAGDNRLLPRLNGIARKKRLLIPALGAAALVAAIGFYFGSGSRTDVADRSSDPPVVAVLPFANSTGDAGQNYFSEGIAEDLINSIGRFDTLRVLSKNSTFGLRSTNIDFKKIRSEFGANYLVEGSARRQDERVRITARLIDTGSGIVLWSQTFNGKLSDIFEIQDSITRKIAGNVASSVLSEETDRRAAIPTPDLTAYDLVLRARAVRHSSNCASNRKFRQLIGDAIASDPDYALAHALKSESLSSRVMLGCTQFHDSTLREAEQAARRAIELGPTEANGYRALGRVLDIFAKADPTIAALSRALELNPSDSKSRAMWGTAKLFLGEFDEAITSYEDALQLEPDQEPLFRFEMALAYYTAGRNQDALRVAEQAIANHPRFYLLRLVAAAAAARLGLAETAATHATAVRPVIAQIDYKGVAKGFVKPEHASHWLDGLKLAGLDVEVP